ncbi:hypothetical protein C479_03676 [Halovivax asiaticus JCM 14624]|uniref:Lipoprotein n=1 Tax=Halovivax asiaticus JCM 14624 TaxID=1227490 RepID=M0BW86_9EURY|nr:hypothetical protein [Halovivax asiaticus]ELZ13914.1 hypothetical protein C479_03676 [Halovivax asiaticus JCM 14624]
MRRRNYLGTIGAGTVYPLTSGCLSAANASYSISDGCSSDTCPDAITHDAEIVDGGYADEETPLTISTRITNSTSESITYADRRLVHMDCVRSTDDQFALYAVDRLDGGDTENNEFTGDCWRATVGCISDLLVRSRELAPEESAERALYVLVPEEQPCPEDSPGQIRFRTAGTVRRTDDEDGTETSFEWTVTLEQS